MRDTNSHTATVSRPLVWLFACAAALSVANVYYAQPLLDTLAQEFGMHPSSSGMVITATQAGCTLALLLVVPLGDMLNRRRLTLLQLGLLGISLAALACATSTAALLAGMLLVGLLGTAMTQGLIAYAASVAPSHERGRVVGTAQGGVVIGLLLARTLSGVVTDLAGWRAVYLLSAGLSLALLLLLWRMLPPPVAPARKLSYGALLASMFDLLKTHRVLRVRGVLALLLFAVFSIFWSALVFPLSAQGYSHAAVGAFGLVGVAGALGAARAGAMADRGRAQWTTGAALLLLLASWLPLAFAGSALWPLIAGIIALDLAGQAIHVTNQSLIFKHDSDAHSRLVACYMLFYAVGSGLGAIAATSVYALALWHGVCALGAAVSLMALVFWRLTLPSN
ncbi:MFS transporter [Janthinobacterium psychrotolerans]|uniref:Putative arabinose efflux permease, MFS family n=1 Tax=Janthinobacterium psychrotolerans TaxID=1747903 RepID=A0A1A7C0K4_9BURK|nr:MFS transporter [Janthinobacterium psychrotolerans]OBV39272.1 putative arabinose efflux permease, MFS family [Janthinobacterium psychrotolerans]